MADVNNHPEDNEKSKKESKCEHGKRRRICKDCGGSGICEHGKRRSICKECGGGSICEHGSIRSVCKDCGGGSICEETKDELFDRLRQLRIEYDIRVVSNYSPSIAILIGNYFCNNK